ncbi:hypothetical protein [Staphylococcus cohnii]|uniref:hypothetical protein n=1 Tax=Staphylococcus cohnii TaxID=29382 RepID=UPI003CE9E28F
MSDKEFVFKKLNEIYDIYNEIDDYLPSPEAAEYIYLEKGHVIDFRDECEEEFDINSKVIDINGR